MPSERIKEVVDFATTESPYRSANKGWVTDNIFLQWGSTKEKKSKEFDQLAKVSVYWQPIIQTASILLFVIVLASILAFLPLALSQGKLHSKIEKGGSTVELKAALEQTETVAASTSTVEPKALEQTVAVRKTQMSKPIDRVVAIPKNTKPKRMVTATDLFQQKQS